MADEIWKAYREDAKKRRHSNHENSVERLKEAGIHFTLLDSNTMHYRVGDWNFWPTTGKFYNPKTQEKGRGVFSLIAKFGR